MASRVSLMQGTLSVMLALQPYPTGRITLVATGQTIAGSRYLTRYKVIKIKLDSPEWVLSGGVSGWPG